MAIVVYVGMFVTFVSIGFGCWWSNRRSVILNWPVVGMIPSILYNASRTYDFLTDILQQSNGTFIFKGPWFCGMDFVITSDPMNVHHILTKNFSNYPKGHDFNQIVETLLGNGIFNADSDSWRIQRTMIHSLLKDKRFQLSLHTSIHHKISKGLFSVLDHACQFGNELDIQDMFQRFNFDNICTLVFGTDPNTLSIEFPHVPFEKAFDDVGQVVLYRHMVPAVIWKFQRWLQIGQEKKMTRACHVFYTFVNQCIKTKQQELEQNRNRNRNINRFDALTYFLQMEDIQVSSNKFIRDMALNLLFAGRDTTSAALSWTFWLIATNISSQKNILEEMEQHFGSHKCRFLDFEKMRKLVYLHAVICEALRLYPSVPFGHKVSIESDDLPSGHHISKNTKMLYSLYSMGRMKEIWGEDCLQFKPERWISPTGGIKHYPSYKFIAFNSGPRTCLGIDVVFFQMKSIVSAILWNYSLQLIQNEHASPSTSAILHHKNGLKVRVYKRMV
ncbi:alkane hydroxylase MAH1-like [Euphorbia lathyris]|uniref:alkane hydroxylase MAH1-like n=1 Tax=Euphorbia lathyris TaxID=212925 RepID=UPI0033141606